MPLGPTEVTARIVDRVIAGRYRLGAVLGTGGMGVVHEAEHVLLGSTMAVKLLHGAGSSALDPVTVRRIEREARAAAAFRHPNVVAVTDFGHDEVLGPYVVMERLEGESLASLLDQTPQLSVERAVEIAARVLAGLAAGHARSLVHRDVKPSNVFLARDPEGQTCVKLLDFGTSKSVIDRRDEITHAGVFFGTPPYMPPETLFEGAPDGPSGDVYAVGVLLYQMLTGRLPYRADTPAGVLEGILAGGPPLPSRFAPDLPAALETLVMRTLSPDVASRPSSARAMREALEAILTERRQQTGRGDEASGVRRREQEPTTEIDGPIEAELRVLAHHDAPTHLLPRSQPPPPAPAARESALAPALALLALALVACALTVVSILFAPTR